MSGPSSEDPVLQGLWNHVRVAQGHVQLTPYLPALYAFLTHVLLCAPFLVLDALSGVSQRIQSWKIATKPAPSLSLRRWLECFGAVLWNYTTGILPVTVLVQILRDPAVPELAPTCWQLCVEIVACFLLFDTLFFALHYAMHRIPWLYRHVHQKHHQHHIPFALAAQDSSTSELLSLLLLALSSAWLVGCHPLSEIIFHLLNSWLAVEAHSGYNLPWGLHRLLPFIIGGAPHHQAHHRKQNGNYAPYFTHWDRLCGTYHAPRPAFLIKVTNLKPL